MESRLRSLTTRSETASFVWPGAVLGAVIALGLLDQQVITPLIAALAAGLGVGVADVGLAISAYSFAAALAALVMGPLSDARGRRPFLLFGATLMLASAGVISLIPHYAAFVLARLAAGFAGGTIAALAVAWIADLVPYRRRGRVMAFLMGGAMGAAVLGQVGAAFAAGRFGHQIVYGAIAILAAMALAMLLALPEARPRERVPGPLRRRLAGHLEFLGSPVHRAAAFAAFCMSGSLVGVSAYASGWLQEVRGFSLETVGVLYGGLGAAIMVAQLIAGPLSDRLGKRRFTVLASIAAAAMTPVLPWLSGTALVVAILLFGCLAVARIAAFTALRSELVPRTRRASFLGFSNVFSQLGIAAAVAAGGMLYPYGFEPVCWLMAGLGVLAVVLITRVPEPGSVAGTATVNG
ncbi:MAG: MFS transporter [Acidobacteria bacterium]|nr:MFS transporter [Acidobacteriota bacterium]MYG75625.1 MFS transporter [Acidobacteriota bacterium]